MSELAPAQRGRASREVDGVVLLDKPVGMSSNIALQKVRRIFGARKAGHTGSLDPLASGLLPVCLGQATRFSGYLLDASKSYRVTGRLGERTATGDTEGEVVERCAWEQVDRASMEAALRGFRGAIEQVPPMYSALKQGGERLYRKARRGEVVERAARSIQVYELALEHWAPPEFSLELSCSKGTYVRTLVEDVARAVGSCAHVTALRRYRAGPFEAEAMLTLESLQALGEEGPDRLATTLLAPDAALAELSALTLDAGDAERLQKGQEVDLPQGAGGAGLVRLYGPTGFLGVGERIADSRLRVKRLMSLPSNG